MMLFGILAVLCVSVTGASITAGDLAKAEPVFTPADPNVRLGYAPIPGVQRLMHPSEARQLLRGLEITSNVPLREACFERPMEPLSIDAVRTAMRKALGPEPRLEISDLSAFAVPAEGELVFQMGDLGQPPIALWRGYVSYDGNKRFRVWARVKISVTTRRLVAVQDLKQGVPIKLSQVAFQPVEEFPQKRVTPLSLEHLEASLPRHFIPANSPVWSDSIDPPLDITKGDLVSVTVSSGLAKISIDAEAETSGRRGDPVFLKNLESGKLFRGRIDAPGQAALEALR
jgi:flagella basal body P-ring formation protein FlgA